MNPKEYLAIIEQAGKLKTTMRHCYTQDDRRESVADHSWRLALMAMLLAGEPAFEETDIDKVIRMCVIHDIGESFTGDIPAFLKSEADADAEVDGYRAWVGHFPEPQRGEWLTLIEEMEALETPEAKTYKALDKLEALIAHNESDLSTWLPLEYDLQMTYGQKNMEFSPYFKELRKVVDAWTMSKIQSAAETKKTAEPAPPESAAVRNK